MTTRDSFTLTLASNACMKTQPDNKQTEFVNDAYEEMHLDGEWEMYPVEITFEKSWFNFLKEDYFIWFIEKDLPKETSEIFSKTNSGEIPYQIVHTVEQFSKHAPHKIFRIMKLPKSHFSEIGKLVDYINTTYESLFDGVQGVPMMKLLFDPIFNRVRMIGSPSVTIGSSTGYTFLVLGFDPGPDITIMRHSYDPISILRRPLAIASGAPHLNDVTMIFVYCDIIEYQLVADTRLPLIGIVVVDKNLPFGSMVRFVWKVPQPMKVVTNNIRNIRIKLADPEGKPIPFTRGVLSLILRFRRRGFV